MKFHKFAFLAVAAATLVACGGGGGGGSAPAATTPVANAFDATVGTYSTGCLKEIVGYGVGFTPIYGSVRGTVVVSDPVGDKAATISVRSEEFNTSDSCDAAKINEDITIKGQVTDLGTTKTVSNSTRTITAKVVEFRYDSLKISMGSLTGTLPTLGTKGKGGYAIEGNKAYVLKGTRGADGVQSELSTVVLTKQ